MSKTICVHDIVQCTFHSIESDGTVNIRKESPFRVVKIGLEYVLQKQIIRNGYMVDSNCPPIKVREMGYLTATLKKVYYIHLPIGTTGALTKEMLHEISSKN